MPRHSRHRGAGERDARHAGLGTPPAAGPINITPAPVEMVMSVVDPLVVLSPINITPDPVEMVMDVVNPTVDITTGKIIYVWIRVNGVDVPNSNSVQLVTGNEILSVEQMLELEAGDYIQLMFAVGDITVSLEAIPVSAFAPAIPSVTLNVREICQ